MLDKTLNGEDYTPTTGDTKFAHQLAVASALRSSSTRRTKSVSSAHLPQSSPRVDHPEQKHSPGGTLHLSVREGDSVSRKSEGKNENENELRKSDNKIEVETHSSDKKDEVKPSD
jgi:hypothetical protein